MFPLYLLSVLGILGGLGGYVLWGVVEAIVARLRRQSVTSRHYWTVAVALWGLLAFSAAFTLARNVRGALPTGSHLMEFDAAAWKDPNSSSFVRGDITTRQKMLGSVVERLGPSLDRADIEAMLGPSGQADHSDGTGYDLIYGTGPERDSFIGFDSEWLVIWLDDAGKFERYAITGD